MEMTGPGRGQDICVPIIVIAIGAITVPGGLIAIITLIPVI